MKYSEGYKRFNPEAVCNAKDAHKIGYNARNNGALRSFCPFYRFNLAESWHNGFSLFESIANKNNWRM